MREHPGQRGDGGTHWAKIADLSWEILYRLLLFTQRSAKVKVVSIPFNLQQRH